MRRNLLPRLGALRLRQLQPETVRSTHVSIAEEASADQAATSYRLLHAILATAVQDGKIARTPCMVKCGGSENTPERPWVETELVLRLAQAIEPRYSALVELAGFGSTRTSEMLRLRRRDVNPLQGTVKVRESKSDAGAHEVYLPADVMARLKDHLDIYAQPGPEGAVFTGPTGRPLRRATLSDAWQAACKKVSAPSGLHIHDLRHHAATMTARMPGVTTKELMRRIGHSSSRAALIYQHATDERDAEIARWLQGQIEAAQSEQRHEPRHLRAISDGSNVSTDSDSPLTS